MSRLAMLVLAAGRARRFGADKRVARLDDGRGLLEASLAALEGVDAERFVALRAGETLAGLAPGSHGWRTLALAESEQGMGATLAAAVTRISIASRASALLVQLGDMPWVAARTLEALIDHIDERRIVRPLHHGRGGHPVLFGRRFWPALCSLEGDRGARPVLERAGEALIELECLDPGVLADVDRCEALHWPRG
ncbi:nucleotidyltransferase family protein [Halotalea alkalilenta]|nr:nucleotidyltransferase family protein [Halotalea alkalilenta]